MKTKKTVEFSKKLLVIDYVVLIALVVASALLPEVEFTSIIVAWIAQLGISSTAYYWKAKADNRTKIPFKVIETLPEDIRKELNLTEIIVSMINSE